MSATFTKVTSATGDKSKETWINLSTISTMVRHDGFTRLHDAHVPSNPRHEPHFDVLETPVQLLANAVWR